MRYNSTKLRHKDSKNTFYILEEIKLYDLSVCYLHQEKSKKILKVEKYLLNIPSLFMRRVSP